MDGGNLQDRLKSSNPIPHVKVLSWLMNLTDALDYAHGAGDSRKSKADDGGLRCQ